MNRMVLERYADEELTVVRLQHLLMSCFGFEKVSMGRFRRRTETDETFISFHEDDFSIRIRRSYGTESASVTVNPDGAYAESYPSIELLECLDGYKLVFRSDAMKTSIEIYQEAE